jgi:hypothetical protein
LSHVLVCFVLLCASDQYLLSAEYAQEFPPGSLVVVKEDDRTYVVLVATGQALMESQRAANAVPHTRSPDVPEDMHEVCIPFEKTLQRSKPGSQVPVRFVFNSDSIALVHKTKVRAFRREDLSASCLSRHSCLPYAACIRTIYCDWHGQPRPGSGLLIGQRVSVYWPQESDLWDACFYSGVMECDGVLRYEGCDHVSLHCKDGATLYLLNLTSDAEPLWLPLSPLEWHFAPAGQQFTQISSV